jgi:hypothetical protein
LALLNSTTATVNALCLPCKASPLVEKMIYPKLEHRSVFNLRITNPTASTTWIGGSKVNKLEHRSVFNPRITNPTASTTWTGGSKVNITWYVTLC